MEESGAEEMIHQQEEIRIEPADVELTSKDPPELSTPVLSATKLSFASITVTKRDQPKPDLDSTPVQDERDEDADLGGGEPKLDVAELLKDNDKMSGQIASQLLKDSDMSGDYQVRQVQALQPTTQVSEAVQVEARRAHARPTSASSWSTRSYALPLIYCSPEGVISVFLRAEVVVEMSVDRTFRVCRSGKFAASINPTANQSSIMHPHSRIYHEDAKVFAWFKDEKQAVIGSQGILFTMEGLQRVYLVSSERALKGPLQYPRAAVVFPQIPYDATLRILYTSETGSPLYHKCCEIVHQAQHRVDEHGSTNIVLNGVCIRQGPDDDVEVMHRQRHVLLSPRNDTVAIRTHFVHMGVESDGKSFIKRGVKRVHVSHSGMVVSDGNQTVSLDFAGRVVSEK